MNGETNGLPTPDTVIFGEIQVLIAEKRTALASLRTGIAVFALPRLCQTPGVSQRRPTVSAETADATTD